MVSTVVGQTGVAFLTPGMECTTDTMVSTISMVAPTSIKELIKGIRETTDITDPQLDLQITFHI